MKCNETLGKWYKNKHGVSKIMDTFETYQSAKINLVAHRYYEAPHILMCFFCSVISVISQ
jgi:hypothetical protein